MNEQRDQQEETSALGIDLQNANRISKEEKQLPKEKPEEEDTSKEVIATHDDRSQDEGVDEQYGGDASDNRDEINHDDDSLI